MSTVLRQHSTACGIDAPTDPSAGRLTPTTPSLLLTGATSTPIFPTAEPGDQQTTGDARGLNASGQITGAEFGLTSIGDTKPYRWTPGAGAVMLVGCCDTQRGTDINDAGVVAGTTQQSLIVGTRGFIAVGTSMVTLPILPGGLVDFDAGALAINTAGQVAGYSPAPGFSRHAVVWSAGGVIQDLGTLGGTNSEALDINASGQVIGSSQIAGDAATHFFLWSSSIRRPVVRPTRFYTLPQQGLRDLGTLGMEDITAITGLANVGLLNDNLQTVTGYAAPNAPVGLATSTIPRLVQLQFTPTAADAAGTSIGSMAAARRAA